jgi:U2-associated protein SR140
MCDVAHEGRTGSFDSGDPETTNIHVANLPPDVTEATLGYFFAKFGSIGSLKIMWPRGGLEGGPGAGMTSVRRSNMSGLSGFVAFMRRRDAERAIRELDGYEWEGSVLRCTWGKSMPMPPRPIYGKFLILLFFCKSCAEALEKVASESSRDRSRSPRRGKRSRSPDRRRNRSPSNSGEREMSWRRRGRRPSSPPRPVSRSRSRSRSPHRRRHSRSRSASPRQWPRIDAEEEYFIRNVWDKIREHGSHFETMIRQRERGNPRFAFLEDEKVCMSTHYSSTVRAYARVE